MEIFIDHMKETQDKLHIPSRVNDYLRISKELGAEGVALSVPYDRPGGAENGAQMMGWVTPARALGLKVWHRQSFCSDQGWHGVAKDTTKDRLQDIKNYIITHAAQYKAGDIFCPKPEPQNMGINGVNVGGGGRFSGKESFNKWLRDAITVARDAFVQIGIPDMRIGYYGFDGFITCGYENPDHHGRSVLEPETVAAMGNIITVDHYPAATKSKSMADFIGVFKQTWPGVDMYIGEYGMMHTETYTEDPVVQLTKTFNDLKADPIVKGLNYWHLGPDGTVERLIDANLAILPAGVRFKELVGGLPVPTPTPIPVPVPVPVPSDEKIIAVEGVSTTIALTNKGNLWKFSKNKWSKLPLPDFK